MDREWLQYVFYGVAAIGGFFYLRYMMGRVGKGMSKHLERVGLSKVEGVGSGGSRFEGSYRGYPAGYAQGSAAMSKAVVSGVLGGTEYWAGAQLAALPLAIVERSDNEWKKLPAAAVPPQPVKTGHTAFDARFSLRCADPEWARAVVSDELRQRMLALPLAMLVTWEGRVFFPLRFDGKRWVKAFGNASQLVVEQPELFLDTALALVSAIEAKTTRCP